MKEEAQLVTSFSQAERTKETTLQESKIFLDEIIKGNSQMESSLGRFVGGGGGE